VWNENIDVETCQFIANTTGAGIEHPGGSGAALDYDYTNLIFSGNTYDVFNNAAADIDINKLGTSNPTTYIADSGIVVNFIGNTVTVQVTVVTTAGAVIQDARVILEAKDGTGPFPFEESVTISNSGVTATVTHTGHGMASNDYVTIRGASHALNNGVYQITVTNANTYTYTMTSAPGSSPTGSIISTYVALYGLSNASGIVTDNRVYDSDQPVTGHSRKSTTSPLYKTANLVGTIDSADGYSATAVMILDE
jgi:hypothetical protein